eukprot:scaffold52471_cov33-Phaeocystis_antarctica.AAC.1
MLSRCISPHLAAYRRISLQALPGINAHARRFPLAGAQSGASLIVFKSAEQAGRTAASHDRPLAAPRRTSPQLVS